MVRARRLKGMLIDGGIYSDANPTLGLVIFGRYGLKPGGVKDVDPVELSKPENPPESKDLSDTRGIESGSFDSNP